MECAGLAAVAMVVVAEGLAQLLADDPGRRIEQHVGMVGSWGAHVLVWGGNVY